MNQPFLPLTEDFVRTTVANYCVLEERIKDVAIAVEELRGGTRNAFDDYHNFYFEDGRLYANFEYYCCGGTECDCVEIPLEYLWTENFEEIEKAHLQAARQEAARQAEIKRVADEGERQRKHEEHDRREWERLRKRFGS